MDGSLCVTIDFLGAGADGDGYSGYSTPRSTGEERIIGIYRVFIPTKQEQTRYRKLSGSGLLLESFCGITQHPGVSTIITMIASGLGIL